MAQETKQQKTTEQKRKSAGACLLKILLGGLLVLPLAIWTLWAAGMLYYSNLPAPFLRTLAALACVLSAPAILIRVRPFRRAVLTWAIMPAAVNLYWLWIPASNDRQWQPDVAVLPWAEIDGSQITVHNIRNCDYRSKTDFTVRHYDKTFRLDDLKTFDLYMIYWGSPLICHTIVSFGFGQDEYLAVSIETRKETGESYSAVKGFFKQFELTYIVADERDVVRLRTHYRNEEVYLYRLHPPREMIRQVFLDYFRCINDLRRRPRWYNALTHNCTTTIRGHTKPYNPKARWDWRILANGYLDRILFEQRGAELGLTYQQLREQSRINEEALAADRDDFSRAVREGLPTLVPPARP